MPQIYAPHDQASHIPRVSLANTASAILRTPTHSNIANNRNKINGASRRNRTDDTCLEGRGFTIKLYSQSQAESETFGLSVKHFIKI